MHVYFTDHYLVDKGDITPDDSLITVNGSLSMTLTAILYNSTNLSKVPVIQLHYTEYKDFVCSCNNYVGIYDDIICWGSVSMFRQ